MSKNKHRHHSPDQKMIILKRHLVDKIAVSEVCREYDIQPSVFYKWQQELFSSGEIIFNSKQGSKKKSSYEKKISQLEEKLQKKHEV